MDGEEEGWISKYSFKLGRLFRWIVDRRTTLSFIALVVFLASLLPLVFSKDRLLVEEYQHDYARSTEQEASKIKGELSFECSKPTAFKLLDCEAYADNTYQHDYAAQYDLKAQQNMSVWTTRIGWFGFFGLVCSIFGVAFVYASILETRKIGQNQSKAYLFAKEAEFSYIGGYAGISGERLKICTSILKLVFAMLELLPLPIFKDMVGLK